MNIKCNDRKTAKFNETSFLLSVNFVTYNDQNRADIHQRILGRSENEWSMRIPYSDEEVLFAEDASCEIDNYIFTNENSFFTYLYSNWDEDNEYDSGLVVVNLIKETPIIIEDMFSWYINFQELRNLDQKIFLSTIQITYTDLIYEILGSYPGRSSTFSITPTRNMIRKPRQN